MAKIRKFQDGQNKALFSIGSTPKYRRLGAFYFVSLPPQKHPFRLSDFRSDHIHAMYLGIIDHEVNTHNSKNYCVAVISPALLFYSTPCFLTAKVNQPGAVRIHFYAVGVRLLRSCDGSSKYAADSSEEVYSCNRRASARCCHCSH